MPILTSPKKLYKRMIPILVNSHLYMLGTVYQTEYGNRHKERTWTIFVTEDYAFLEREHIALNLKWIGKNGEDS